MTVEDDVRSTIRRRGLAGPGTRVVAAVSGGADSVALAHLLRALSAAGELQLVGLAHFNHRLRPEADADEAFCGEVARSLNLPLIADGADVRELARRDRRSIEDAARTVRHAFFERARLEAAADVVAVGHTRDDQAETFLLRLLRGAGARGLASMHPRNGVIIRPLLDCRRGALTGYLASRGIGFVEDASNADVAIPRNRVRAELLPILIDRFNPSVVEALADAADLAQEEWAWLNAAAGELEGRISRREGERLMIDVAMLSQAPPALARATLRRLVSTGSRGRPVDFRTVDQVLQLSLGEGADFDAPGQRVQRIGATIVLTGRPANAVGRPQPSEPVTPGFRYPLSVPGEVEVPEIGCAISAEEVNAEGLTARDVYASEDAGTGPVGAAAQGGRMVVVQRNRCGNGLAVRNRRPGDRFRPVGGAGRKKLQDFFVDRKVDRRIRDRVPLVVDSADRIVWVAGHAANDEFRVTDPAQAVIILRLKGVGGAV